MGGFGITGSNQSQEALAQLVDGAMDRWGRVDVLVNSAGHGPKGDILEMTDEDWHGGLDVYLMNVIRPTRLVTRIMAAQGGGSVVNVGSGSGWGKPNMAAYSASKGGIFALSAALALDHFHDRIRVNTVVPGGGGIVAGSGSGRNARCSHEPRAGSVPRIGTSVPGAPFTNIDRSTMSL